MIFKKKQSVYKIEQRKLLYLILLSLFFSASFTLDLKGQCQFEIDENAIDDLPIVTVYVNFHFQSNAQGQTYTNDPSGVVGSGQFIATEIVENFNNSMQNVTPNFFPGPNGVPANPLPNNEGRLRLEFYPSFEEALHFYGVNDTYGSVYEDQVLDIRIRDASPCGGFFGRAFDLFSTELTLWNMFCNDENPDAPYIIHAVPHEVLHTFGLRHSHDCMQRAFDIDPDFECHPNDPSLGCDEDAGVCQAENTDGNNLMGDNQDGNAITPGQLELVFDHLLTTDFDNFELGSCEKTDPPFYVQSTTEEIWDFPRFFYGDVIVETGTVLRIQCKVYMAHKAKIRVRRGARLIVEGTTITSTCPDKEWGGIVVNGNAAIPHHPDMTMEHLPLNPTDPGVLHLKGATLLNAGTAVSTRRCCVPYAEQKAGRGGLVLANTTKFKNCRRGVEFLSYNFPNLSAFTDACTFESDRGSHGVTIWGCEGILFDACEFFNMGNTTNNGNFTDDAGITILNGGAIIQNQCKFNDLSIGINALNTAPGISNRRLLIGNESNGLLRNEFENNQQHILSESFDLLDIFKNDFFDHTSSSFTAGVALNESNRAYIFDNSFVSTNLRLARNFGRTITIEKNQFNDGGSPGSIFVINDNRSTNFDNNCFENTLSDVGFLTNANSRINTTQGSLNEPRFNSFSEGHLPHLDFNVPSTAFEHTYYYHPDADPNNLSLIPRCGINNYISDCSLTPRNFMAFESGITPTPSGLQPCASLEMIIKDDPECLTLDCLKNLRDSIDYKNELFDGGDKPSLITALNNYPNDTETIQMLNDASPYLSDGVVEAIILNEMMDETSKSAILMDNAPLSRAMMELAVSNVESSTYLSLESIAQNNSLSERKLLESEIDNLNFDYQLTLQERVYQLNLTENFSDIIETLQYDNSADSKRRLFGVYLQMEDFTNAQAALDMLPENTIEEQIFKDIQEINLAFASSTEEFELSPTQDSLLYDLANQNTRFTNYARALLALLKNEVFVDKSKEEDYTVQQLSISKLPTQLNKKILDEKLQFYPNPTHSEVNIKLPSNLEVNATTEIRFFNHSGNLIKHSKVLLGNTEIKISINTLPEGIYFIGLWHNDKLDSYNKLIVHK